jgi:hypothetical protein
VSEEGSEMTVLKRGQHRELREDSILWEENSGYHKRKFFTRNAPLSPSPSLRDAKKDRVLARSLL